MYKIGRIMAAGQAPPPAARAMAPPADLTQIWRLVAVGGFKEIKKEVKSLAFAGVSLA